MCFVLFPYDNYSLTLPTDFIFQVCSEKSQEKGERPRKESWGVGWPLLKMGVINRERSVWIFLGLIVVFLVPICHGTTDPLDGNSKHSLLFFRFPFGICIYACVCLHYICICAHTHVY